MMDVWKCDQSITNVTKVLKYEICPKGINNVIWKMWLRFKNCDQGYRVQK